jgi:O-antigen/teichoic acid export membrane protein
MTEPDVLDSPEAGATAIRGVLLRSVFYGAGLLVSLATVPFLIRHLGPVDYGFYVTVGAIVFIVGGITEGGLTNLGLRHYSADSTAEERAAIVRNLVGVRLVLTTIGIALATGVAALAGAASEIVVGIPLYGAGLLLTMISASYAIPLQANLRLGLTSGLEFLRQTLNSAGTLALVAIGAGLYAFFGLWIAVCALITVLTAGIVRKHVSIRPAFHTPTWRRYLGDAFAYGVASAAGLIYFRMAATLMTFLSTDLETGYFGAAFRVLETGTTIPWLFVTSVFPILARAATSDRVRLRYASQKVLEVGLIVGAAMTLVLTVGAQPVMQLAGGDEFADAVPALRVQGVVLLGTVFVSTWSLLLLSLDEQRALLAVNGTAVVVSCAAAFVLIPEYGAVGGSIVVLIAEGLVAVASAIVLRLRHPDIAPRFIPLWRVCAAAGFSLLGLLVPAGPIVQTLATMVLYAVGILVLRAIPAELWRALRPGGRAGAA